MVGFIDTGEPTRHEQKLSIKLNKIEEGQVGINKRVDTLAEGVAELKRSIRVLTIVLSIAIVIVAFLAVPALYRQPPSIHVTANTLPAQGYAGIVEGVGGVANTVNGANPSHPEHVNVGLWCVVRASELDERGQIMTPANMECSQSEGEALEQLVKRIREEGEIAGVASHFIEAVTVDNVKDVLTAIKRGESVDMSASQALIGVNYSATNYNGSATFIYGNWNGCNSGSSYGVAWVSWIVNSSISLGGCTRNVHYDQYSYPPYGSATVTCLHTCSNVGIAVKSEQWFLH